MTRDRGMRLWYRPIVTGLTVIDDERDTAHRLGKSLAVKPPAGQLIATHAGVDGPNDASQVDRKAAEEHFGRKWVEWAIARAGMNEGNRPAGRAQDLLRRFVQLARNGAGQEQSHNWAIPKDLRGSIRNSPVSVLIAASAPHHPGTAPREARIEIREERYPTPVRVVALGATGPDTWALDAGGNWRPFAYDGDDVARAVAHVCDPAHEMRALPTKAALIEGAARACEAANWNHGTRIQIEFYDGTTTWMPINDLIETLATTTRIATPPTIHDGWEVDLLEEDTGRSVLCDGRRTPAAPNGVQRIKRSLEDSEWNEAAQRLVDQLICRQQGTEPFKRNRVNTKLINEVGTITG